jgi:hypothetical protein
MTGHLLLSLFAIFIIELRVLVDVRMIFFGYRLRGSPVWLPFQCLDANGNAQR